MAITFDQFLGSNNANALGGSGTLVITTGQTAAAGSRIVFTVSWFDTGGGVLTVADAAGAYTKDKQTDNGSDHFAVFSRVLAGSLASGSAITLTIPVAFAGGGVLIAACSYLGTTGVDTTATNNTTGTGFSSGAAVNSVADALFVGGAGNEAASTTVGGTNTSGTSRADQYNVAAGQGARMLDLIVSSIGSQALTGTWNATSTATTGALVIYKGTAVTPAASGSRFLPRLLGPKAVGPTFFAALQPLFNPPIGPAVLAAATADTSLSTSSCVRVLALPRPVADTSASSDAVTRTQALPRSTADTSLSSDVATRSAQSFARSSADTSSSGDVLTRTLALPRASADSSTSSDAVSRHLVLARTSADTSTSSDTATRVLLLPRSSADTSLSSDVLTASTAAHFARSTADTSLTSDSATPVTRFPRSSADTTTSSDALTRTLALPRATSDTSLSSDATTRAPMHYVRFTADTSLTSDSVTHGAQPQPPPITPPTTATIASQHAAGLIVAYHSAVVMPDMGGDADLGTHTSTAAVTGYHSTPVIVAYTSHATIVAYTSSARLGPTYG